MRTGQSSVTRRSAEDPGAAAVTPGARAWPKRALAAALAASLAVLSAVVLPTAADAAPPSAEVRYSWPESVGGPDCSARSPLTCGYTNAFVRLVDALPAWSGEGARPQAWVSFYSVNQPRIRTALLAADARGVAVHLVTWRIKTKDTGLPSDHLGVDLTGELKAMVEALALSDHSTVTVCQGSCFAGGNAGRQHAKLLATADPVAKQYRVMSGSGNSVWQSDDGAWNDWVVESSKPHYTMVADYLNRAKKDRKQKTPKPVKDKALDSTLYLMPVTNDPLLTKLKAVRYRKGCTVRVDMYQASGSAVVTRYVDRLVKIHKAGCFVRVIGNNALSGADPAWPAATIARLQAAGIEVLDGYRGPLLHMHEKRVVIDAKGVSGDWIGSVNWTRPSLETNMENALWRNGKTAALEGIAHDDRLARHAEPWVAASPVPPPT